MSSSAKTALSTTEIWSLIIEFLTYAISIGSTVLLTNYLTSSEYSHFILAAYTFTLVIPLLLRGSNLSIFTFVGSYISSKNQSDLDSFLSWELKALVYGSMVFIGLLILTALGIYFWDPTFYESGYRVIIIYLFVAPFWALSAIQSNILLALKKYIAYYLTGELLQPLCYFVLLLIFVLVHKKLDYKTVLISVYASYLMSIVLQSIWLKTIPNAQSFQTFWDYTTATIDKTWRAYSFKLFFNLELSVIKSSVGAYIVVWFSNSITAAGVYSVISKVAVMIYLVNVALSSILTPLISSAIKSKKGVQQFQSVLNSVNLYQLIIGSILLAIMVIFAKPILHLFGAEYTRGTMTLRIYCGLLFLSNFSAIGASILKYAGSIQSEIYINIGTVIFLCLVGAVATHYFQLIGFMVTLGCTYLLSDLIASGIVRTKYGIKVMTFI